MYILYLGYLTILQQIPFSCHEVFRHRQFKGAGGLHENFLEFDFVVVSDR